VTLTRVYRVDDGDEPIVIADYGSSQGKNSLAPMRVAAEISRSRVGSDRPILVCHIDLAINDFNVVEQARARNATAIQSGRVDLRHGSVVSLPFDDNSIDKALAINSMQVWPDAVAGLREIRRVMKPGGWIALLIAAGFTKAHVVETDKGFCALATKP
jgi:SAM-dependent methyltransferase